MVRSFMRRHQTTSFFILTLAVSWLWWLFAFFVLAGGGELTNALILPGGFGPLLAAAIVIRASGDDLRAWARRIVAWRVGFRWYLLALGLPVLLFLASVGITALFGAPFESVDVGRRVLGYLAGFLVVLLVGGGLPEEPGWRGFALPRLQGEYGRLVASVVIGIVWAVWHLPLFLMNAPRNTSGSFLLYGLLVVAISILLTWLYNQTQGSVLLPMIMHASINSAGTFIPVQSMERLGEWATILEWSLIGVFWLAALIVVLRSNWKLSGRPVEAKGSGAAPADSAA